MTIRMRAGGTRKSYWLESFLRYGWLAFVLLAPVLLLLGYLVWQQRQPAYDLLIENGMVFDGDRKLLWGTGLGVRGDRIDRVGIVYGLRSKHRINARGMIVAPGFIDTHVHIERNIIEGKRFRAPNFVHMGVTTVITGNCGMSWKGPIGSMLSSIDKSGGQVNVATLVGHNTVREAVMKQPRNIATLAELDQMRAAVDRAMREGALGFSSGLEYAPGAFADEAELVRLAEVAARWGGVYATHTRNEASGYAEAIKEALRTAQQAKIPLHISHLKIASRGKWSEMPALMATLQRSRDSGQKVTQDMYAYTASSSSLDLLLPVDYRGLTTHAREVVGDPSQRENLVRGMLVQLRKGGFDDYSFARVSWFRDPQLNGKTIPQVAELLPALGVARLSWLEPLVQGKLRDEIEAILHIFTHGGAQMIYFVIGEENVKTVLRDSRTVIGTDAGVVYGEPSSTHPRGSGNFPRVLAKYVREERVLDWRVALQRMTSLPADIFQIEKRGRLRKGYAADIVIFSPDRIEDRADYDHPVDSPLGIDYVLVNGQVVAKQGEIQPVFPGRAIRAAGAMKSLPPVTKLAPRNSTEDVTFIVEEPAEQRPKARHRTAKEGKRERGGGRE